MSGIADDDLRTVSRSVIRSVDEWTTEIEDHEEVRTTLSRYHSYVLKKWIFMAVCIVLVIIVWWI